jgi:hypothetical protein
MGTEFTVVAYGQDLRLLAETVEEVFQEIDRIDEQMKLQTRERTLPD